MIDTVVSVREVSAAVREGFGVSAGMINTGGGCGAISVTLETGHELLITSGDVFFAGGGDVQPWSDHWTVGVYPPGSEYDGEALRMEFGPEGDSSTGALLDTLRRVLSTAGPRLFSRPDCALGRAWR